MTRSTRVTTTAFAAALLVAASTAVATPAHAATFEVTTNADSGAGSLRQAVLDANASAGPDTVTFAVGLAGQTIELDGVIIVTETLDIDGLGSAQLTIERSAPIVMDMLAFQPIAAGQDFTVRGITLLGDGSTAGSGVIANNNVETPRDVSLDDVVINDMFTTIDGAAMNVFIISGSLSIIDSFFASNVSDADGGAVRAAGVGEHITIVNSEFESNVADGEGGAVATDGLAGVTIEASTFTSNEAETGGGLAVRTDGALEIEQSTFVRNDASAGGGLFAATVTEPSRIVDSTFDDNAAGQRGGGAYIDEALARVTVSRSLFDSNTALFSAQSGSYGGGLYVGTVRDGGSLVVDSTTFTGHRLDPGLLSNGSGLGLAVNEVASGSEVQIINSTLSERAQTQGAAIYLGDLAEGSTSTIEHSTVVGEYGVRVNDNLGTVNVRHSILVNGAVMGGGLALSGLGNPVSMAWSLSTGAIVPAITDNGGNQFSADPQLGPLADNGGPTPTLLPATSSPALNTGDPAIAGEPAVDQRGSGFDRILQGRIDLGAVETDAELAATGTEWVPGLLAGGFTLLLLGVAILAPRRRRA